MRASIRLSSSTPSNDLYETNGMQAFFQYEFMLFQLISRSDQSPAFHRPSTNVAARSSIIDAFQRSDLKFNL
jgi:hypothetical protein